MNILEFSYSGNPDPAVEAPLHWRPFHPPTRIFPDRSSASKVISWCASVADSFLLCLPRLSGSLGSTEAAASGLVLEDMLAGSVTQRLKPGRVDRPSRVGSLQLGQAASISAEA